MLTNDATIEQDGKQVFKLENIQLQVNDVIGVAYNHIELKFFINGKQIEKTFHGLKGEQYPIVYVNNGAILDTSFNSFSHQPPAGFDSIMIEKSLL